MLQAIKLFLRNARRKRMFSIINLLGLTAGFFSATVIYLYVQNERNYDRFHELGYRIYRINQTFIWGDDNPNQFSSTGPGVAYAINEEIPEVELITKIHTPDMMPVTFFEGDNEQFYNDEDLLAVDSNFLQVFTFPLSVGDKTTALKEPNSVVLTHETAEKFFGEEDPIGKLVELGAGEGKGSYQVTGVLEPIKSNSYVQFDMLVSLNSIERVARSDWNWIWTMFETYVVVNEHTDLEILQEKLSQLPAKHGIQSLDVMGYTSYDDYVAAGKKWELFLHPLMDIYLHSENVYNRISDPGSSKVVYAMIGSAIFIIILSCINFINLSTAEYTTKARNVALRKILGSSKAALRNQFFSESLIFCLTSAITSLALVYYSLPIINQGLNLNLEFSMQSDWGILLFVLLLVLLISVISSSYPAIFFNAFKPVTAIKGELKAGHAGKNLRNGMLMVQYVLSFILIASTIVVYLQLDYFINADMGFQRDNIVSLENTDWLAADQFAQEVRSIEGVQGTAVCDGMPLLIVNGDQFIPDTPEKEGVPLNFSVSDQNYLELLEIELLVGRNFDSTHINDKNAVILNEAAIHTIGWEVDERVLNRKIENWSGEYHIIGVVKDFNLWSVGAPVEPFALFHLDGGANFFPLSRILLKTDGTNPDDFQTIMGNIEAKWSEFAPNKPFEYLVLNQVFADLFQSVDRFGGILSFFAFLTIIIASLGLLGIVIFTIEQKLKEVGIRKVLGASIFSIVSLFTKTYVKLLLLASLVATPASFFLMDAWLSDFDYRMEVSPWIFFCTLLVLMFLSMGICTFHSVRASLKNPSTVLKDD